MASAVCSPSAVDQAAGTCSYDSLFPIAATGPRLPSERPIDQRWDRSRGIVFSNARPVTPRPHRRSPHARLYSSRILGETDSRLINPNKVPQTATLDLADVRKKAAEERQALNKTEKDLETMKKDAERYLQKKQAEAKSMLVEVEPLQRQIAQLQRTVQSLENKLKQSRKDAMEHAEAEAIKSRAKIDQLVRERDKAGEAASNKAMIDIARIDEQGKRRGIELAKQYEQDLRARETTLITQCEDRIVDIVQRRTDRKVEGRADYGTYQKLFDALIHAVRAFVADLLDVHQALSRASRSRQEQPSGIELDQGHAERLKGLYKSVRDLKDAMENLRRPAHWSRRLTRNLRLLKHTNNHTMTDLFLLFANERPFRLLRIDIEKDFVDARQRLKRSVGKAGRQHAQEDVHRVKSKLSILNTIVSVHFRARDAAVSRALLADNILEKEAYVKTLEARNHMDQANREWGTLEKDGPFVEPENEVSEQDQNELRPRYRRKSREGQDHLRQVEELVRKRAFLEHSMAGDEERSRWERELDEKIGRELSQKKTLEREALERVVGRRASRSPRSSTAYAQPKPVRSTGGRTRSLSIPAKSAVRSVSRDRPRTERPTSEQNAIEQVKGGPVTALNLKPTAPMQASHVQWGPRSRRFHVVFGKAQTAMPSQETASAKTSAGDWVVLDPALLPHDASGTVHASLALTDHAALPQSSIEDQHTTTTVAYCARHNDNGHDAHAAESSEIPANEEHMEGNTNDQPEGPPNIAGNAVGEEPYQPSSSEDSASNFEDAALSSEDSASSSEDTASSSEDTASQDQDVEPSSSELVEESPQLTYQIPPLEYRDAVIASPNTSAAFWSHALYRNPAGDKPKVHLCVNFETAEREAQKLLAESVLGFDLEWEPHWRGSKSALIKDNASLIQLAAEDRICLFQVAAFAGNGIDQLMPPSLRQILESDSVVKTGVNVQGDARRLKQWMGVDMQGLFELSHLFRVVTLSQSQPGQVNRKLVSLAEQVQKILLLPLKKDEVRTSAWSKRLNSQQSEYAAADAYAGLRLYHALEGKRKVMDPMPPRPAFYEKHEDLVLGDGTKIAAKRSKPSPVPGIPVEEDEDEFFDAVEHLDINELPVAVVAGVPLSGIHVAYPKLTADETETEPVIDDTPQPTLEQPAPLKDSTKPAVKASRTGPPSSPEVELADAWASSWKASLPPEYNLQVGHPTLRAYHLWHVQDYDVKAVAAFCREPPLSITTIASYILEALKKENLPFKTERAREVFVALPASVHGKYRKILDKMSV